MKKERIDILSTAKGLFQTREQAKRAIMAGLVKVNNEVLDKPGIKVPEDATIVVKGNTHPFVSRGGLKLLKAIEQFGLNMENKVVLDIGASTGGFTDCSLQHGAIEVYAIDVGYGQLAWTLRQDKRVHVMERTNFRYLKKDNLQFSNPNFATIDVSFISLKIILDNLILLLEADSEVIALVKPQFEAGRGMVGKKGIVREPEVHKQVLKEIIEYAVAKGYNFIDLTFSPIKGGEGNIEFLLYLKTTDLEDGLSNLEQKINNVVTEAHQNLKE